MKTLNYRCPTPVSLPGWPLSWKYTSGYSLCQPRLLIDHNRGSLLTQKTEYEWEVYFYYAKPQRLRAHLWPKSNLAYPVWYNNQLLFYFLIYLFSLEVNYFTILYWFFHTLTWICHGCTCVPHPEPPSHLPSHPISLGHSIAPAPSTLYHASNLGRQFVSHMIINMFQCHSPKSSHPRPLPQTPKDCSIASFALIFS